MELINHTRTHTDMWMNWKLHGLSVLNCVIVTVCVCVYFLLDVGESWYVLYSFFFFLSALQSVFVLFSVSHGRNLRRLGLACFIQPLIWWENLRFLICILENRRNHFFFYHQENEKNGDHLTFFGILNYSCIFRPYLFLFSPFKKNTLNYFVLPMMSFPPSPTSKRLYNFWVCPAQFDWVEFGKCCSTVLYYLLKKKTFLHCSLVNIYIDW